MAMKSMSIVIATFNSERTLPRVLASIRRQVYPKNLIDILVVDGGSTDKTIPIAKKYGCRVLHNPRTVPAWAKYIGYKEAKGKYLMYLDSDEVIVHTNSLKRKAAVLELSNSVRAVTGSGYRNPRGYSILNQYVNEFGDPFSFFIYRLSKGESFFVPSMKERYHTVEDNTDHVVFDFFGIAQLPIFELVAMGSMVDREYIRKQFPHVDLEPGLIPHLFYLLITKRAQICIINNDPLLHYSANSWSGYLRKIRSRIVNNVFTSAKEGFRGRDELNNANPLKKYLFIPYALTLIWPLFDALYLSISRKNAGYLLHVPLSLYTAFLILYYTGMRSVGVRYSAARYG